MTISLAPSLTRTPRYSYVPPAVLQIATREVSVVPKMTAASGLVQRAVESTYPWLSYGGTAVGAAKASGTPRTTSAEVAAAAMIRPVLRSAEVFINSTRPQFYVAQPARMRDVAEVQPNR